MEYVRYGWSVPLLPLPLDFDPVPQVRRVVAAFRLVLPVTDLVRIAIGSNDVTLVTGLPRQSEPKLSCQVSVLGVSTSGALAKRTVGWRAAVRQAWFTLDALLQRSRHTHT
jgi:hypothetical protein